MNKTTFLILLLVLSAFSILAQSEKNIEPKQIVADARLSEAFGNDFVERIIAENPSLVQYYNFFLDNSYYIAELPQEKTEFINSLPSLSISPQSDLSKINVLNYDVQLNFDKETYFRMQNSNKVMVFYSGEELNEKFNAHRKNLALLNKSRTK